MPAPVRVAAAGEAREVGGGGGVGEAGPLAVARRGAAVFAAAAAAVAVAGVESGGRGGGSRGGQLPLLPLLLLPAAPLFAQDGPVSFFKRG